MRVAAVRRGQRPDGAGDRLAGRRASVGAGDERQPGRQRVGGGHAGGLRRPGVGDRQRVGRVTPAVIVDGPVLAIDTSALVVTFSVAVAVLFPASGRPSSCATVAELTSGPAGASRRPWPAR